VNIITSLNDSAGGLRTYYQIPFVCSRFSTFMYTAQSHSIY